MGKRGNEHAQMRKEDFEAMEASKSGEAPKGPFSKASADQMKKRRILKSSSASKWAALSPTATPGASSNNPFSNVVLAGAAPAASAAPPAKKAPPLVQLSVNATKQILEYLIPNMKAHPQKPQGEAVEAYLGYMDAIKRAHFGNQTAAAAPASPFPSTPENNSGGRDWKSKNSPNGGWVPRSNSESAAPLASTSNVPAGVIAPSGFSFPPSSTPATPAVPPAAATDKSDAPAASSETQDATATEESSTTRDPNSEWQVRYEVRAAYYKSSEPDVPPKRFCTGPLRLETSSATSKHRMVMRDNTGKVQLNLAIVKDMPFTKQIQSGKKHQHAFVVFYAQEDSSSDKQTLFKLRVDPSSLDALDENLNKLAAE